MALRTPVQVRSGGNFALLARNARRSRNRMRGGEGSQDLQSAGPGWPPCSAGVSGVRRAGPSARVSLQGAGVNCRAARNEGKSASSALSEHLCAHGHGVHAAAIPPADRPATARQECDAKTGRGAPCRHRGRWRLGLDTDYTVDAGFIGESYGFSAAARGPGRRSGVTLITRF